LSSSTTVIQECIWASVAAGSQIATGGTASTPSGGTAGNAFDGNGGTVWQSGNFTAAISGNGHSLVYDWGSGNDVEPVELRIAFSGLITLAPRDFYIECSDDGVYWFYRHYVSGQTGWTNPSTRTFSIPAASVNEAIETHPYWRIYVSGVAGGNSNGIHLTEIAWANSVSGPQIATGGNATASSAVSAVTNAYDGNNGTKFQSSALTSGWQWTGYEFASPADPLEVRMRTQTSTTTGAPTTFYIQYSDDNSRWTDAYYTTGLSWSNAETKSFTAGTGSVLVAERKSRRFWPSREFAESFPDGFQRTFPQG